MTVRTNNLQLAGDIVQSMVSFLHLDQLSSTAEFVGETDAVVEALRAVGALEGTLQALTSDIAEYAQRARGLLVRAEDSRSLGNM